LEHEHAGYQSSYFFRSTDSIASCSNGCKYCQALVSDVRIPELTGFQLVRKVRDLRLEMKVIMMTMFEVNKREFEAVFPSTLIDAIIRKPFTPWQLVQKIEDFWAR
jgi:DNA-binding NtrC family response regulator